MLYHRRLAPQGRVFQNASEAKTAVTEGWVDSPAKLPKVAEISLAELREDFNLADEEYRRWTSGGACQPGSSKWEEVTAGRNSAKDRYDFALREAELSKANQPVVQRGMERLETFETAFSRFEVRGILGEGANGRVYDVRDEDDKTWAIKCLKPGSLSRQKLKRFKNEIAFCSKIKHPNLINVEDWGLAEMAGTRVPFYVMPQYPSTLRKLMASTIHTSTVVWWFEQLLDGIGAAHDQGVWHRDLKPENLLCDPVARKLVVADFGIAHLAEGLLQTTIETLPHDRMANFQYAAPEQRGSGLVDHRADIYALGLILNELFSGELLQGTGHKTIGSVAPDFAYLDSLVDRMIRQSPNERPSIAEIRKELTGNRVSLPVSAVVSGGNAVHRMIDTNPAQIEQLPSWADSVATEMKAVPQEFKFEAEIRGQGLALLVAQIFDENAGHHAEIILTNIQGITNGRRHTIASLHKGEVFRYGRVYLTIATSSHELHFDQPQGWWLISGPKDYPQVEYRWGDKREYGRLILEPREYLASIEIHAGGKMTERTVQFNLSRDGIDYFKVGP